MQGLADRNERTSSLRSALARFFARARSSLLRLSPGGPTRDVLATGPAPWPMKDGPAGLEPSDGEGEGDGCPRLLRRETVVQSASSAACGGSPLAIARTDEVKLANARTASGDVQLAERELELFCYQGVLSKAG